MRQNGWVGAVIAIWALAGCGDDSSPTTPVTTVTRTQAPSADFPAGTSIRVVAGGTEAPVAGADVTVGSDTVVTDDNGSFVLPRDYNEGTQVDVAASGYLLRQTRLRRLTGTRFGLWPTESDTGLTEAFIFDVVYHLSSSGESSHMMRIRPLTAMAYVAPSQQILADARSMRAVNDAVTELNDISRGEIVFAVASEPPSGAVSFELVVDPNELPEDVVGQARRRFSGWNIIGGTLLFDSIESVRTSATHHELGHMFGLGHSNSRADVMYPFLHRRVETFAPRERQAMRIMLDRPAATQKPDNDRNVASAQTLRTEWVSVIDCYR